MSIGSLGKPLSATGDGYVTLPGGVLLQWGLEPNIASEGTISFPRAFGGNPWAISLQLYGFAIEGDGAEPWSITARSSTNFTITHNDVGGASADWMWIAIGPV